MQKLFASIAGLIFGAGLIIGGMTQPAKVIGFLDFAGKWDASLAFVMGGAVAVSAIAYQFISKRTAPVLAPEFAIPQARAVDRRLLAGAVLFGIGWGLGGFCPGPAVTSVLSGHLAAPVFVVGMLAGMAVYALLVEHAGAVASDCGAVLSTQDVDA
ncbi:MAG: YeeE/YedE family protein [Candidatus Binataceae bacterium]|nr:YeeE/YedE family protein [Candidatus Binataceae bacterium]